MFRSSQKHVLTFSIALTIDFIKFGPDGEIMARASPCFISGLNYLNNVSNFNVSEIIHSSVTQIQKRYDDFVGKGSGWTIQGLKFYDLHITQTHDLRGGCNRLIIGDLKELVSRKAGLLSINNNDRRCLLYCIAAAFTCRKQMSLLQKSDPKYYSEFVNLIKVSDSSYSLKFPVSLTEITELERINRSRVNSLLFRVNVFREDLISKKLSLIRSSPYDDGKIINVLLTEFTINNEDYGHYVLIESMSFLKKRYTNSISGKLSYANSLFCKICFEHFRSENTLETHEKICGENHTR